MTGKERLRAALEHTVLGHAVLQTRRNLRDERASRKLDGYTYEFVDRSRGCEKLCIVLAGYKQALWEDVFGRIAAFVPDDVDMCIMTSGLVSEELRSIAEAHGWSYLSTSVNHLSLVQNIAIECHPQAKWIYKLDEDMFVTRGFFENLFNTYGRVQNDSVYEPAFVAPLINVNCYGHIRLLQKLSLYDDFKRTGISEAIVSDGLKRNKSAIEDPRVALYMWGDSQEQLCDIDALSVSFASEPFEYSVCPVRFSIGAILFNRDLWSEMGGFPITFIGSDYGIGDDEEFLCRYAFDSARAIIVSENCLVGHLGYGGAQTQRMMSYHAEHPERFALPEGC